jgi:hypothetical protein
MPIAVIKPSGGATNAERKHSITPGLLARIGQAILIYLCHREFWPP